MVPVSYLCMSVRCLSDRRWRCIPIKHTTESDKQADDDGGRGRTRYALRLLQRNTHDWRLFPSIVESEGIMRLRSRETVVYSVEDDSFFEGVNQP
jgi:hypothetical protein